MADYLGFRLLDNAADLYPRDFVGDDDVVQFMQPISDADLQKDIQAARCSARSTVDSSAARTASLSRISIRAWSAS